MPWNFCPVVTSSSTAPIILKPASSSTISRSNPGGWGVTPCLACLLESGNSSQALEETCDTIGVLGPIVNLVASWQVAEALKILAGRPEALHGRLLSGDVWTGRMQAIRLARNPE